MTLGSDIAAKLPELRAEAESRMTETIEAGSWGESVNADTLATQTTFEASAYSGPAQVKYPGLQSAERVAGGQQFTATDIVVKTPFAAAIIPVGASIRVTASTSDPALVGKAYRVTGPPQSGQVTARRYPVVEE